MIGLSIHSDAIRAVRLKSSGGKFFLKSYNEVQLLENTVANGELVDTDAFLDSLEALKEDMDIGPDEDVYVGLPNGIFKIDSFYVKAEGLTVNSLLDKAYETGVDRSFLVRFLYMSGEYRVDSEVFARHGLTQEQIQKRVEQQMNAQAEGGEEPQQKFVMVRTVSYAAAMKSKIDAYCDAFEKAHLRVCTLEPEAVARIRYLIGDASQPFLSVDMEYDYASFIGFSERRGMFLLNASGIGFDNMFISRQDADGNEVDALNRTSVGKFLGFANLAIDFFNDNVLIGEKDIRQIIFFDGSVGALIDETESEFGSIEVLQADSMIPVDLSEKKLDQMISDDFYLYYLPIVLCGNKDVPFRVSDDVDRGIEANFLSEQAKDAALFGRIQQWLKKGSAGVAGAAFVYCLAIVGVNMANIVNAGFLQATPPEVVEKYEDAKKKGDELKENIARYNAIAKHREVFVPVMDSIMAARPNDVYIMNFTLSGKAGRTRKVVLECMTSNPDGPSKFLDGIVKVPGLGKARILSQQVKDGKTAVQIVVPLSGKESGEDSRREKRNKTDEKM